MSRRRRAAAIVAVVLLGAWLRAPYITRGVPFFHQVDEAHHFHRTVQMVKDGSFDPKYFNKPSLHFYLRMPVVAAAFISAVRAGEIRRVDEMMTRKLGDTGGWALTASHPRVMIWSRAFGVVLGLLVLMPVFAITRTMTRSDTAAIGAMLLTAVSPALSADAAKVGVDTPLVLMSALAVWLALRLHERFTPAGLLVAGLVAGLAVSTKYNAGPIALVPLAAVVMTRHATPGMIALALAAPVAGFLLGTPYALLRLPEFLNDLAFESWHYGTAGHGSATGTPGLPQAWHYIGWFANGVAIGLMGVVLGVAGMIVLVVRRDPRAPTMLLFPLAFLALMSAQKVNFTRNVLCLIPMIAVFAAVGASALTPYARRLPIALLLVAAIQPAVHAVRASRPLPRDSRLVAGEWLERAAGPRSETIVGAAVGWPRSGPGTRNVTVQPEDALDPIALYMAGFDRVVTTAPLFVAAGDGILREEHVVPGARPGAAVPISPEVHIYRLYEPLGTAASAWLARPRAGVAAPARYGPSDARRAPGARSCWTDQGHDGSAAGAGGDCWLPGRLSRIRLDAAAIATLRGNAVTVRGEFYSPWPNQQCSLQAGAWRSGDLCAGQSAAQWFAFSVDVPATDLRRDAALVVRVQEVHAQTAGRRTIRTGLAVRHLTLQP